MGVEKAAGIIQTGKKCGCRNAARIENLTPSQNSSPISWPADKRFNPLPPPSSLHCPANMRARPPALTTHTHIIYIIYATKKIIFLIRITLHEPGHRVPAAPRRDSYTYTAPMAELARAASRVARKNLTAAAFTGQSPRACCCYYLLLPSQNTNHPRNSRTN